MFRTVLLSRFAWIFYRLLSATWRVRVIEDPLFVSRKGAGLPTVLAHWHGDELAVLHLVSRLHLATMTSTSSDGQIIDYVIRRLGGVTSKGSSTRGGIVALKGLLRWGKSGRPVSMAVDGPKGPLHQVKSGVFEISRLLDAPIFPVGVFCTNVFVFKKSWNRAILPFPFSRIAIVFDKPLAPVSKQADPRSSELAERLSLSLDNAKQQALKFIAVP
ncbi:MAG: lysophospholipid acyltransferase family protein [Bdellovibrionales bacterium]|nr:lysophospholipid acyltransferase family protein [Bdellovibrionales bacterium]